MINTEMMLGYIVKSNRSIADIAESVKMSELDLIKCIANISDFNVSQVLDLCYDLSISPDDCIELFFHGVPKTR